MSKAGTKLAIIVGGAVLALSGCGGTNFAAYEADETAACFIDRGAWAGEARTRRYVEAALLELDDHFEVFLGDLERATLAAGETSPARWPATFESLHLETGAIIVELGRLLPRLNRPLDIPPLIEQFESREIWGPRGDARTEFLRVALAEEFLNHQNFADHQVGFLRALEQVEGLLLTLKTGGAEADRRRLVTAIAALAEGWEGVEPHLFLVIFDRPQMPAGESLSERLQARVRAICAAYSDCDRNDGGCGPVAQGDRLTGESMDDGA